MTGVESVRHAALTHDARQQPAALTDLERRIVQLVALGQRNGDIGRELGMSEDGVKSALSQRVYRKLGARDRASAVHRAHQQGVL